MTVRVTVWVAVGDCTTICRYDVGVHLAGLEQFLTVDLVVQVVG